jgi:uncharacterized protein (DUF58 family)
MLSPELIKKIRRVHIRSARKVNTLMAGHYRSVFRGSGIEFEEVREYTPGDDVKSIDWRVSARMGRPYIKRFREERERLVMLLVDMSASGNFGTRQSLKREVSAEIAAILAFNAICNNDKVGAILFTDQVERYIPPQKGSAHVWRVIKEIFDFHPRRTGTDIQRAIRFLGRIGRKRGLVFLISDYLAAGYTKALKVSAKKHEFVGILVSDPGDFSLPEAGMLLMEDLESGRRLFLDAADAATRRRYADERTAAHQRTKDILKSADIDCIDISTAGSVTDALTRYFRYREKRKR